MKIAESLKSYGFDVYLSERGTHGFYTDGKRVVSFQKDGRISGNYEPTLAHGTGWQLATYFFDISKDKAHEYITAPSPAWANRNPIYTTPEKYLKRYGVSSRFAKI